MEHSKRGTYVLGRDFMASIRLYMLHYLWKDQFGSTLSSAILNLPQERLKTLRVADLACGTGQWLIDSSRLLPETAQLDGFDISTEQFPHQAWLPKNVALAQLDLLSIPPAELEGAYDVVHVGLVVTIAKSKPSLVLQNLLRLLKPGGIIQWDDLDLAGFKIEAPSQDILHPNMTALNHKVRDALGFVPENYHWVPYLDTVMIGEGLEVLLKDYKPIPDTIVRPWTWAHLLSFSELKPFIESVPSSGPGEGKAATEQLDEEGGMSWDPDHAFWQRYAAAVDEAKNGATTRVGMIRVVARKP